MHRFVNFKNFKDAQLELFSNFTLLLGRNGSGKTNAIEGIELLAALAEGRLLRDVVDVGRGVGGHEVRGGLSDCIRRGADSFELSFLAAWKDTDSFAYRVEIAVDASPYVRRESLVATKRNVPVFEARSIGPAGHRLLEVTYDNFAKGPNKPSLQVSSDATVLSRFEQVIPSVASPKGASYREIVSGVHAFLRRSFVLDAHPHAMRTYERVGDTTLRRDASNLSSVLHGLSTTPEGKETLARILAVVKQLPEEPFGEFHFEATRLGDVLFALRREDQSIVDARLLSDGTLRCLAAITALETVPPVSQVILEEFDNGIHPSRVKTLVDATLEIASRRKLRVIVTTHNPATLNALPDACLAGVHLCIWDAAITASRIVPLREIQGVETLLEHAQLGDLVTRNVIERHLAPGFDEAQKAASRAWLESLR